MQVIIVADVSGHVYIYPNTVGHTIKGLALIEYENNDCSIYMNEIFYGHAPIVNGLL
jgi:hypothetical protein